MIKSAAWRRIFHEGCMIQLHQYYNHATGLSVVSLSLNICSTLIDFNVTEVIPGLEEKIILPIWENYSGLQPEYLQELQNESVRKITVCPDEIGYFAEGKDKNCVYYIRDFL